MNYVVTSPPNAEAEAATKVRPVSQYRKRMRGRGKEIRAKIFRFICAYKAANDGNSPNVRTITDELKISSTSETYRQMRVLESLGRIVVPRGTARSIQVIGGKWTFKEDKNATF